MTSLQHQRRGYLTSHSSVSESIFCSCCWKKKSHKAWYHASLVLGRSMQGMLLHIVTQLHRNTTRLSLISNKEVQIFQNPLLRVDEWQLWGEQQHASGAIILAVFFPVCAPSSLTSFQTYDDYKHDRRVCLLLSSFHRRRKLSEENNNAETSTSSEQQQQQPMSSCDCVVLSGLCVAVAVGQVRVVVVQFFMSGVVKFCMYCQSSSAFVRKKNVDTSLCSL